MILSCISISFTILTNAQGIFTHIYAFFYTVEKFPSTCLKQFHFNKKYLCNIFINDYMYYSYLLKQILRL